MSTKIYNAFRFKGELKDLMPFLKQVRDDIEDHTINYYKEYAGSDMPENWINLMKLFEKKNGSYSFEFNIESSVAVYFHGTGIYLHFFFPGHFGNYSDGGLFEKWGNWIEDFHYQNQTDKPDDVSEENWAHREQVFDDLFDRYDTPSRVGLIWNINNDLNKIARKVFNRD